MGLWSSVNQSKTNGAYRYQARKEVFSRGAPLVLNLYPGGM